MKLSLALFAAGSVAFSFGTSTTHSNAKRDSSAIANALTTVVNAVDGLYQEISTFAGTGAQVDALTYSTGDVFDAIEAGTTAAQNSPDLTTNDVLPLASITQNLSSLSYASVATLIKKKDVFLAAGIGPIILQTMKQQLTKSQAFTSAVLSKIPAALQPLSQNLSAPITASLQTGIQAYGDQSTLKSTSASSRATVAPLTGLAALALAAVVAIFAF